MILIAVTAFAILLSLSTGATADIIKRGTIEKMLADEIRNAGHTCTRVLSYENWKGADADDIRSRRLSPLRAHCSNGMVFGVGALPIRPHARRLLAAGNGGKLPTPMVKRLR